MKLEYFLERGIAPLGPPVPAQPPLLGHGIAPPSHCPWPRAWGSSTWPPIQPTKALYTQQKQDQELTMAQIMNSLLPNSDLN